MDITKEDIRRDWAAPPNLVSYARLLLIAPVTWLIMEPGAAGWWGWTLLMVGVLSDKLDGWLAKRCDGRWTTKLGKLLDPLIDKLYVISVLLAVSLKAGVDVRLWLWALIVAFLAREAVVAWVKSCQPIMSAAEAGRFSMVAQSAAVAWLALPLTLGLDPLGYLAPLVFALGASYCSGWVYVAEWRRPA